VARHEAELDSFDVIEGLMFTGGRRFEVLTGISLHGGLAVAWPMPWVSARAVVPALLAHWHSVGLPGYAQFDNATIFQGAHHYRDSVGRVMRLCLGLGVVPVFAPVQEPGFQAAIESFNARWQAKVWARFRYRDLPSVRERSRRYTEAACLARDQLAREVIAAGLRACGERVRREALPARHAGVDALFDDAGAEVLAHLPRRDRDFDRRVCR
jgi:hypothetical protein